MKTDDKPDILASCVFLGVLILYGAFAIDLAFTRPTALDRWDIAVEGKRLDEELRVVRERYEHRQALPSAPSLTSRKGVGGE